MNTPLQTNIIPLFASIGTIGPDSNEIIQESIDQLMIMNIAQFQSMRTALNQDNLFDSTSSLDCSSQISPCPTGCQEILGCFGQFSCGYFINLVGFSLQDAMNSGCTCTCQEAQSNAMDHPQLQENLITFYQSTHGEEWYQSTNWLMPNITYCSYFGIYCTQEGSITTFGMINNLLHGIFPPIVFESNGLNETLMSVIMNNNLLSGPIPSTMVDLSNLIAYDLSSNELTGNEDTL